jgi:hypothetical protein
MAKILCQAKLPPCAEVTNEIEGRVLVAIGPDPDCLLAKLKPLIFVCEECAEWVRACGGSVIRYTPGLRVRVEVLPSGSTIPRQLELAELFCDRALAEAHLAWAQMQVRGYLWWVGYRNSTLGPKVEETLAPVRAAFAEGNFGLVLTLAEEAVAATRKLWRQMQTPTPGRV